MLMGAWNSTYDGDLNALTEDIELKKKKKLGTKKIKGGRGPQKEESVLKVQLEVIKKLERGRRGPVYVLDELASIIPKRVWLDQVEEKKNVVSLKGYGIENADISRIHESFGEKSILFERDFVVHRKPKKRDDISVYSFTKIICLVDYAA